MTRPRIQIAVDAHDPHALCRFWAAALDYEIEDHHDQIVALAEQGHLSLDDEQVTIELDGRRVFATAAACVDPDGTGPRLLFQTVPEPKTVKDRIHIDVSPVAGSTRDEEVARILALGATRADVGQGDDVGWVVLADPEGNEFCLLRTRRD